MTSSSRTHRPRIACEVSVDRVVAARGSQHGDGLEAYATTDLPEGSVAPDLTEANVLRGDSLRQAITGALDNVAGRSRDLVLILPDAAVRVVLLDFETLPGKRQEAEPVVRFRLKKSLHFD